LDWAIEAAMAPSAPETPYDQGRLAAWTELHRAVDHLGESDRERFNRLWYQGLTQAEAAGLRGVTERTVNRRWWAA
jgi:RNA polymerase sigma-70 factor (ECF subfamily)